MLPTPSDQALVFCIRDLITPIPRDGSMASIGNIIWLRPVTSGPRRLFHMLVEPENGRVRASCLDPACWDTLSAQLGVRVESVHEAPRFGTRSGPSGIREPIYAALFVTLCYVILSWIWRILSFV